MSCEARGAAPWCAPCRATRALELAKKQDEALIAALIRATRSEVRGGVQRALAERDAALSSLRALSEDVDRRITEGRIEWRDYGCRGCWTEAADGFLCHRHAALSLLAKYPVKP